MVKENFGEISGRSSNRFNPYSTPVHLRPLREFKYLSFSKNIVSKTAPADNANVDIDALTEYQRLISEIKENKYGLTNNNYSPKAPKVPITPVTSHSQNSGIRIFQSPGYPLRELKIQRSYDNYQSSLLSKLSTIKDYLDNMPKLNAVSSARPSLIDDPLRLFSRCFDKNVNSSNQFSAATAVNGAAGRTSGGLLKHLLDADVLGHGDYRTKPSSSSSSMLPPLFRQSLSGMSITALLNTHKSSHIFNAAPSPRVLSPGYYSSKSTTPTTLNLGSSASSLVDGLILSEEREKFRSAPNLSTPYISHQHSTLPGATTDVSTAGSPNDMSCTLVGTSNDSCFLEGGLTTKNNVLARSESMTSLRSDATAALKRQQIVERGERTYHDRRLADEKEKRRNEIRRLEEESSIRQKARLNRQIQDAEYMRMRLGLEGLVLERKPKEEPFPELPEEAEELLRRAWNHRAPPNEVFSTAFSVDIMRRDLLTLRGVEWLNDEIINFYLNLIVERSRQNSDLLNVYAFNTFFYQSLSSKGYDSIKRWTRKVDIFSYDLLLVPIHLAVHWCMATVDLVNKTITYYDSMLGDNDLCLKILHDYLSLEHENKKKTPLSTAGWKVVARKDIPRQLNGSDCGMFACKFAEYASRGASINFTQAQMPYFRQRMVYEICTQKLL